MTINQLFYLILIVWPLALWFMGNLIKGKRHVSWVWTVTFFVMLMVPSIFVLGELALKGAPAKYSSGLVVLGFIDFFVVSCLGIRFVNIAHKINSSKF